MIMMPRKVMETETSKGWGDTFSVDVDSWKCDSCMVEYKAAAKICAACESSRARNKKESSGVVEKEIIGSNHYLVQIMVLDLLFLQPVYPH